MLRCEQWVSERDACHLLCGFLISFVSVVADCYYRTLSPSLQPQRRLAAFSLTHFFSFDDKRVQLFSGGSEGLSASGLLCLYEK